MGSAPARGFAAEAAAAPAKSADLDWDALGASIGSDNGKRELALLRTTYIDVAQKLSDLTKVPRGVFTVARLAIIL